MIELIREVLSERLTTITNSISAYKVVTMIESVDCCNLDELTHRVNEIASKEGISPNSILISGNGNDYSLELTYDREVLKTDKDIQDDIKGLVNVSSFKKVYDKLTSSGYKRISSGSKAYEKFKDTSVYDMYINSQWELLEEYYSLSFDKI